MFRHKFNNRIDAYAAWTFRSGDRATVPMQYVENPSLPGTVQPSDAAGSWVYEKPNNITLPAYHRLDVGINSGGQPNEVSNVSGISVFTMPIAG